MLKFAVANLNDFALFLLPFPNKAIQPRIGLVLWNWALISFLHFSKLSHGCLIICAFLFFWSESKYGIDFIVSLYYGRSMIPQNAALDHISTPSESGEIPLVINVESQHIFWRFYGMEGDTLLADIQLALPNRCYLLPSGMHKSNTSSCPTITCEEALKRELEYRQKIERSHPHLLVGLNGSPALLNVSFFFFFDGWM